MSITDLSPAQQLADYYLTKADRYMRYSVGAAQDEKLTEEQRDFRSKVLRSQATKFYKRAKYVLA